MKMSRHRHVTKKCFHFLQKHFKSSCTKGRAPSEGSPEIKDILRCRKDSDLYLVLVDENMVNPNWEQPKVVIVGAGMAGLSAAQALHRAGLTDVSVLEAMDRPGGRIMSCNMKSFIADLGACHIEGASAMNPIYNLACQEGLFHSPVVLMNNPYTGTFMTSEGEVAPQLVESTAHHVFANIENEAAHIYAKGIKFPGSLQDFMERKLMEELISFPDMHRMIASKVLFGKLNELRSYWGTDLTDISAEQYGVFTALGGGDVRISTGMVGVLAPLIRDLPDCIRYCSPVVSIKWDEDEEDKPEKEKDKFKESCKDEFSIKVTTCDGDVYPADYVIVTCSLGYLKKNHSKMFKPSLPDEKICAIEKIGFGHINHIYLLYTEPFWVWKEGVVRMAWNKDELMTKRPKEEWIKGIGWTREVLSSVQMLMARVAGEEARHVEELSETRIGEGVTRLMRCFTGDGTLPYPFAVLTSKWSSNPYQLGAKAYMRRGADLGHVRWLGDPLPNATAKVPNVLFAGEATMPSHMGTLHGARMSGLREAERIIKLTHKFEGRPRQELIEQQCHEVLQPVQESQ